MTAPFTPEQEARVREIERDAMPAVIWQAVDPNRLVGHRDILSVVAGDAISRPDSALAVSITAALTAALLALTPCAQQPAFARHAYAEFSA